MKNFQIIILIVFSISFVYSRDSFLLTDLQIIFSSGFEEGNKDIWDDYDTNPDSTNLIMKHPGPFNNESNHVMRLRVPIGRGASDLVKILPGSYNKLYIRWYQMWEFGYDFNANNHGSGIHAGNRNYLGNSGRRPQGNDWYSTWLEPVEGRLNLYTYYRGMYMDCVNPNGQCWGDHFPCWFDEGRYICKKEEHRERIMPPLMETNRWYCLEIMIDSGSPVQSDNEANGVLDFWIDGIEYGPWEHLWFRTTSNLKLNILWFDLFHHADHSIEGILLDEIIVATEQIGCISTDKHSPNPIKEKKITILPNPFYESSTINYQLSIPGSVKLDIYNSLGEKITTLVDEWQDAGNHSSGFDVGAIHELPLPSGLYYYTIRFEDRTESGKLLLVK
jgi:hypothetical protein